LLSNIDEHILKITDIKSNMEYAAYHDKLTGLKNRRALFEDFDKYIQENKKGSLCLLDLNNLKEINDIYGHATGDEILRLIVERINNIINEDTYFYRFGGDEFIIVIFEDLDKVEQECIDIMNCVSRTMKYENIDFNISGCIGISSFPQDGNLSNNLIGKADIAMYYVKHNFKKGFTYFKPFMQDEVNRKSEINIILRNALENNGFKLLYQPIIEAKSGDVVSFEALLRLRDYNISPVDFIKVAEEKGIIIEVGRLVVEEVIKQLHEWKEKNIILRPIAINLSPNQMKDDELIIFTQNLLNKYDIESRYLEIEVTEDILIENSAEAIAFLEGFKSVGLKISLDDFGSGYSSLTYLTYMPIDKIKLDKVLIDKYLNKKNQSIIDSIIRIAHDLEFSVVAEGIESFEQYEMLKLIGCDFIQGYYFSKPVDSEAVEKMLL
jgi:diguanylate cyclase (GGDEF)-like protein